MIILIDTREQLLFSFTKWPEVKTRSGALETGDYFLPKLQYRDGLPLGRLGNQWAMDIQSFRKWFSKYSQPRELQQ